MGSMLLSPDGTSQRAVLPDDGGWFLRSSCCRPGIGYQRYEVVAKREWVSASGPSFESSPGSAPAWPVSRVGARRQSFAACTSVNPQNIFNVIYLPEPPLSRPRSAS